MKYILSKLYLFLIKVRHSLYKYKVFKIHKFNTPIISIGNIELGGTGKTPMTILVSQQLTNLNINHVIISRGYKKETNGLIILNSDSKKHDFSAQECGDEPLLLASKLKGVPILVSENKVNAIKIAQKKFNPKIIILDDAFQSLKISKTLNIVLINSLKADNQFQLFPSGYLREPLWALKRADLIIMTKTNIKRPSRFILDKIKSHYNGDILYSQYIHQLFKFNTKQKQLLQTAENDISSVVLLSGIGDSKSFFKLSKKYSKNIIKEIKLADHYNYNKNIKLVKSKLLNNSLDCGLISIIITLKDFIKINPLLQSSYSFILTNFSNLYVLDIKHEIKNSQLLKQEVLKAVKIEA